MTSQPVTRYLETRALEVFFGALMLACGGILALPGETFALPHYAFVKGYLTEGTGAWILIGAGALRLGALWQNGFMRRSPLLRLIGCMIGAGFWLTMAGAFFEVLITERITEPPLMLGVSITAFLFEAYSGARCGTDASHLDSFGQRERARAADRVRRPS